VWGGGCQKRRQIYPEQMVTELRLAPGPTSTRNRNIKEIMGSPVVASCNLVDWYRRWQGNLPSLSTGSENSSRLSIRIHQTARRHIPDDARLDIHRRNNLKHYKVFRKASYGSEFPQPTFTSAAAENAKLHICPHYYTLPASVYLRLTKC
jgi:hypothetical protein